MAVVLVPFRLMKVMSARFRSRPSRSHKEHTLFKRREIMLVALVPLLAAAKCSVTSWLGVEDDLSDLRDQLRTITGVVNTQMNAAIEAIPGERWLRIVDQLMEACDHRPTARDRKDCEAEKNRVRANLANLAGMGRIDATADYEASAWIEATDGKPLDGVAVDLYRLAIPNSAISSPEERATVVQVALGRDNFQPFKVGDTEWTRPLTRREVDSLVMRAGLELFRRTVSSGIGDARSTGFGTFYTWKSPMTLPTIPCGMPRNPRRCTDSVYGAVSQQFAELFRAAVTAPYSAKVVDSSAIPATATQLRISETFDPLSSRQSLVVTMPESTWHKLRGRTRITLGVHRKAAPDDPLRNTRRVELSMTQFDKNVLVVDNQFGKMVWASRGMTDDDLAPEITLEALREAQRTVRGLLAVIDSSQRRAQGVENKKR
jgi:hypothetical protein